jgi:hypothetical protein
MRALDLIAEQRIQEALRDGAFDDIPGAGAPLALDDEPLVPAEVRSVYRVLKNAGFVPPEVETRRERREANASMQRLDPASQEYRRALQKLRYLDLRLAEQRGTGLCAEAAYTQRLLRRFGVL